jgi:hypothetical protein
MRDDYQYLRRQHQICTAIFSLLSIMIIFFMKLNSFFKSINLEEVCLEQKIIGDLDKFKACVNSSLVELLFTGATVAPMYNVDKTGMKYSIQFSLKMVTIAF